MNFPLRIDSDLELRPLTPDDAPALFALVEANRAHLDRWLRWSAPVQSLEAAQELIGRFADKLVAGDGFHAGLWLRGELVGGLVCHFINRQSAKTEIGYWLAESAVGQGIITRACRTIINALIEDEHMHRIEIQARVENQPSRAVAERLGFTFEGVQREAVWIDGAFRDQAVYSLLAREWPPAKSR